MIDKNKTRKFWDSTAENTQLDQQTAVGMLTEGNEYNARLRDRSEQIHFLKAFSPDESMCVLEVGSGGGRWTFFLGERVKQVVGIDFSDKMIDLATELASKRGISNVEFLHCELTDYDASKQFDIVYFSGVLQYLSDEEVVAQAKKAKSLLNSRGFVVSRDTIQTNTRTQLSGDYPVIYRTIEEYRALFSQAGLTMTYTALSYPDTRFSHFAGKLFELPLMNYSAVRFVHRLLLRINSLLGDPLWLKKAHHRAQLESTGVKEHRFFRYNNIKG